MGSDCPRLAPEGPGLTRTNAHVHIIENKNKILKNGHGYNSGHRINQFYVWVVWDPASCWTQHPVKPGVSSTWHHGGT